MANGCYKRIAKDNLFGRKDSWNYLNTNKTNLSYLFKKSLNYSSLYVVICYFMINKNKSIEKYQFSMREIISNCTVKMKYIYPFFLHISKNWSSFGQKSQVSDLFKSDPPFLFAKSGFFSKWPAFSIYDRERLSSSLALAPQLGRKKGGAKDGRQTWGSNPRRCIPLLFLLLEGQPPQTELSLPLQSQNGSKECQVLLRLRQAWNMNNREWNNKVLANLDKKRGRGHFLED